MKKNTFQKIVLIKKHIQAGLCLTMLLFFGITADAFSQQRTENTLEIKDVDAFLSHLKVRTPIENYTHVKSLLDDLQPSVYFDAGIRNIYGENPNALFTDPESLAGLNNPGIATNTIEIVTIRLSKSNHITRPLDLSVFSNYPALKYIYIISTVPNTNQNIISSVRNRSGNYSIFYKIDLGS